MTDKPLLSISQARERVLDAVAPLDREELAVPDALGRILGEDVSAIADVAPFASSAMDGYAVRSGPSGRSLQIVGEARAGHPFEETLADGQAVRISTGAPLPPGADAVLQQELAQADDGRVTLLDDVRPARNVRGAGEDLRAGEHVLRAGERLGPAELGVAVHAGRARLTCARRPRVAVLATGDELVEPGGKLGPGQIHDSNLVTLSALARQSGADVVEAAHVPDDGPATRAALERALAVADVVIASGGVSVGPHDHVKPALRDLGVEERFWRVALRPGKPTWFGVHDRTLVFGLPGNPVSAMVTFILFVRPALAALQGAGARPTGRTVLGEDVERHPGRDECVRVCLRDGRAYATGPQGSHVLRSMALADGLVVIPRGEQGSLPAGTEVELIEL